MITCPDCLGKGFYQINNKEIDEWLKPFNTPSCRSCSGAGVVTDDKFLGLVKQLMGDASFNATEVLKIALKQIDYLEFDLGIARSDIEYLKDELEQAERKICKLKK